MAHSARDHLDRLPNEIFELVAKNPDLSIHDLAAIAATSRRNHSIANPLLYEKHIREEDGRASK